MGRGLREAGGKLSGQLAARHLGCLIVELTVLYGMTVHTQIYFNYP